MPRTADQLKELTDEVVAWIPTVAGHLYLVNRLDPYGSRSPLPGEQKRSPVRVSKRICPLGAWRVRGQAIWPWSRRLADPASEGDAP